MTEAEFAEIAAWIAEAGEIGRKDRQRTGRRPPWMGFA